MIFPAKSNMYEVNAKSVLSVYGDFVQATGVETLLVLCWRAVSDKARDALVKSAAALGYPAQGIAWAQAEGLGASDLASIVEGLDPLALVVVDAEAAALLERAYRTSGSVALDAVSRLMGRTVVAFRSFEGMLDANAEKQRAWALLKKLPRA